MQLSLTLLGTFNVAWADRPLRFATNPARALFAYLAVEADRPFARAQLATLLWPEQSTTAAFNNLRQTLKRMRASIPDPPGADAVFDITKSTIQFRREVASSDLSRFEDLLAECALHHHADLIACPACANRMEQAVALYRGEFLAGLHVDGGHPFEEWLLFKREQLHRRMQDALGTLILHHEAMGHYEAMRLYAMQQLALEAWHEDAHAQLMRALAYLGDRTAALAQYEACRRLLQDELGIEPTNELRALAERIRAGALDKPQLAAMPPGIPDHWNQIPESAPLFGRQPELAQLQQWLAPDPDGPSRARLDRTGPDPARVIWVFGMGGVGKTSLAATAAHAAMDQVGFDTVFWRSLLNAPPLEEVLRAVVQSLSRPRAVAFPAHLDEQLALLLDLLRQTRCLLVLDNFESILDANDGITYRHTYEGYGQLIECLTINRHRSCLLITSREQPRESARFNGGTGVHILRLAGIGQEAGRAMLAAYHLGAETAAANTLVRRYSGNPLALKLVAQTVQELFMGSIGEFLSAETTIFDDVRTVLDQQFARLSPLQHEILMWLAVGREAVALSALRENLAQPPPPREFLEALRALQRRSLLEQAFEINAAATPAARARLDEGSATFTLQNVIMEYVTDRLVDAICDDIESARFETLNRHALLQARAKEYVLQSQLRLILKPIADRLMATLGRAGLERQLGRILAELHSLPPRRPGYAAGNILNLVLHLGFDTAGYDFSDLSVWQADLREARFAPLNFSGANLANAAFIHAIDVAAVQFIDASQVLVAGIDGSDICMWRIADGQIQNAFQSPGYGNYPIVFSPDGRLVANCGMDYCVRVWSAESGLLLQTLEGHTDQVFHPAFDFEGRRLASGSRDGTVCVWDVQTGQRLNHFWVTDEADLISGLAFSPDGRWLAGGGSKHELWLWDVGSSDERRDQFHKPFREPSREPSQAQQNAPLVRKLQGHVREVECCAFSPDGTLLASGAHDGSIRIWDVASGACLHRLSGHGQLVRVLAFHPHGHMLASGGADRTVRLWDPHEGQALQTLTGHTHEVIALSFNPDGRALASGSVDKTVRQWDPLTGQAIEILSSHADMINAVRCSPAAPIMASSGADGVIRLWDIRGRAHEQTRVALVHHLTQRHASQILAIAFSPDGRRLVSSDAEHLVRLWEVDTGRMICELQGHSGKVSSVAYSPDGRLIASSGADRTIRLWAVDPVDATRSILKAPRAVLLGVLHGHEDEVVSVAFNPSGTLLVSSSLDHTARLWDVAGRREVALMRGHTSTLYGATFTPDGRWVLTNSWNFSINVWDVATHQPVHASYINSIQARGLAFSRDGNLIALVAKDQSIEIRRFNTGELQVRLQGRALMIRSLDFSDDGRVLVSGSWDGDLRLWDTGTGACLAAFHAPGPYAAMNITRATGISEAQRAALQTLGAISDDSSRDGWRFMNLPDR